jgi:hypothetical protein
VFRAAHAPEDELRWLEEEGPFSPRLVRHVREHKDAFDFFFFFSYRYYTTFHGLAGVADKALLVPTAEDDGVLQARHLPVVLPAAACARLQQRRGARDDPARLGQRRRAGRRGRAWARRCPSARIPPASGRAIAWKGRSCCTSAGSTRTRAAASCSTSSGATSRKRARA